MDPCLPWGRVSASSVIAVLRNDKKYIKSLCFLKYIYEVDACIIYETREVFNIKHIHFAIYLAWSLSTHSHFYSSERLSALKGYRIQWTLFITCQNLQFLASMFVCRFVCLSVRLSVCLSVSFVKHNSWTLWHIITKLGPHMEWVSSSSMWHWQISRSWN